MVYEKSYLMISFHLSTNSLNCHAILASFFLLPASRQAARISSPCNGGAPDFSHVFRQSPPAGNQDHTPAGRLSEKRSIPNTKVHAASSSCCGPAPGGPRTKVRFHDAGVKRFHHSVVGDLTLSFETMALSADAGLTMAVYTAEPGSPSHDALNLATWAAMLDQAEMARATDGP